MAASASGDGGRGFLLSCPRDEPKGRRRLGNSSHAKTPRKASPKGEGEWMALTAAELSKRRAQRAKTIGQQLACENAPQGEPEGRR